MTELGTEGPATRTHARRMWWVLPVIVLLLLIAIIYLLGHLSRTNSEMYPTTLRQRATAVLRLC